MAKKSLLDQWVLNGRKRYKREKKVWQRNFKKFRLYFFPKAKYKRAAVQFKVAVGVLTLTWMLVPLSLFHLYSQYEKTVLSFKVAPQYETTLPLRYAEPVEISLNSHPVAIEPGNIADGVWQVSDERAIHLASSARPGENGNVIIYAHNRPHLFRSLHEVSEGDSITVQTDDLKTYEYKVTRVAVVTPEEITAVLPTSYEVLTVYTCTGWLDTKRLVVQAEPVAVSQLSQTP